MRNGGYKILDFKGVAFTDATEKTVAGTWDFLEESRKPTVISGLVIGSTEYPDLTANFTVDSSDYVAYIPTTATDGIFIEVADDDGVTVTLVTGE